MNEKEARLKRAFETKDNPVLVDMYQSEGKAMIAKGQIDDGLVMLVHAYIYALEWGHEDADEIHKILKSHGREE